MSAADAWAPPQVDALIDVALAEDLGTGDVTTRATIPADHRARARVVAKEALVLAGLPFAARVFARVDPEVRLEAVVAEGAEVVAGTVVARVTGPTRSVLAAERTALNILQRLCGTATLARRFAEAVAHTDARVTDTRKTAPGMRVMQKYAAQVGGALNHRFGLDAGVLIKDNHVDAAGGVAEAIARVRAHAPHTLKIEVETRTLAEVDAAVRARADVIMLDNMSLEAMGEAVARIRASSHPTLIEASGNLGLERVADVARLGVDLLSIGAITHSAGVADLSMTIEAGGG